MRNLGLTKLEKKNPLGKLSEGMTTQDIIKNLKKVDFLTHDLKLTRRGKEYVELKMQEMDNVERVMIERYILEHHGVEVNVDYIGKEEEKE